MLGKDFKKSSASTWYPHNNCVEVAQQGEIIAVRDSKNPAGSQLSFSKDEWDAFLKGAKQGEFDISA